MNLTKKFVITIISSVVLIISANIGAMFLFSNIYFKDYIESKNIERKEVTLDYINTIIDQETISYIDNLFVDVEKEFFSLLEENQGNIPLDQAENRNIIINYLIENGVSVKFIEEFLPTNQIQTLLSDIKTENSPERKFIFAFLNSIIAVNLLGILFVIMYMFYFSNKTFKPIRELTLELRNFKVGDKYETISYDKNDEIGLLANAINDLSEKLNKQEEIRHKFLADISHELKTPITAIRCYLEGITDGVIPFTSENIEKVTQEIGRLVNLVNMIMDYEKFNSENLKLELEEKDICEIIKDTVGHYELSLRHGQKIEVNCAPFIEEVDEDRFIQVVHNIVSNFIKYAGDNAVLDIRENDGVIYFTDNGKGVSKDKIPYLTQKFFQVDSSKTGTADERGIGVGLSIVEKIIYSHNWLMEIESERGLGFEIRIFTKTSQK